MNAARQAFCDLANMSTSWGAGGQHQGVELMHIILHTYTAHQPSNLQSLESCCYGCSLLFLTATDSQAPRYRKSTSKPWRLLPWRLPWTDFHNAAPSRTNGTEFSAERHVWAPRKRRLGVDGGQALAA